MIEILVGVAIFLILGFFVWRFESARRESIKAEVKRTLEDHVFRTPKVIAEGYGRGREEGGREGAGGEEYTKSEMVE